MAILKPDKTTNLGGVTVNEFLLTKHNPRNIAMLSVKMEGIIGVTIHNTDWIKTAKGKQHLRNSTLVPPTMVI